MNWDLKTFFNFWPMTIVVPVLLVLILFPSIAGAKDILPNKHTKSNDLSVTKDSFYIVSDVVRAGDVSQKFVLAHGQCKGQDCKWGAHRTERRLKTNHYSSKKIGKTIYYALSIYIPEEFGYQSTAGKMSLFQAKMTGVDMPVWMVYTDGAGYYLKLPGAGRSKCMLGMFIRANKGQWHDFVVKADYGREKVKGHEYFKMWQNGKELDCTTYIPFITKKIMKESKSHGWSSNRQEINMRYGIYKWEIGEFLKFTGTNKQVKYNTFNQPNGYTNIKYPFKYDWGKVLETTVMYYDEIRMGKTLQEVTAQDQAVD